MQYITIGQQIRGHPDVSLFYPSMPMQAFSAGIAATKALLNKKVKTIKVNISSGYKVFFNSNPKSKSRIRQKAMKHFRACLKMLQ